MRDTIAAVAMLIGVSVAAGNAWAIGCPIEPSMVDCRGSGYVTQPAPIYNAPTIYTPPAPAPYYGPAVPSSARPNQRCFGDGWGHVVCQ